MIEDLCLDSPEDKDLARFFAELLSGYSSPCALFNRLMLCIYSNNDYIEEGLNFYNIVNDSFLFPIKDPKSVAVRIKGVSVCAVIYPVMGQDEIVKMYICHFLDSDSAMEIWTKADSSYRVRKLVYKLRNALHGLLSAEDSLKSDLQNDNNKLINGLRAIQQHTMDIGADIDKLSFFVRSYSSSRRHSIIDAAKFAKTVVGRCNEIIAECGRAIEYHYEINDLLINANSEKAVSSLVSALQNALLYSPIDCDPTLNLYKETESTGKEYVVFMVINDTLDDKDHAAGIGTGSGLAMIKNFVNECDGKVSLSYKGKKAILTMKIPAAKPENLVLCSSSFVMYSVNKIDFLEFAMREVVNFCNSQHTVTENTN